MTIEEKFNRDDQDRIIYYEVNADTFTQAIYTNNMISIAFPYNQWKTITLSNKEISKYEDSQGNYWDDTYSHKCPFKNPTKDLRIATLELVLATTKQDLIYLKELKDTSLSILDNILSEEKHVIEEQIIESIQGLENYVELLNQYKQSRHEGISGGYVIGDGTIQINNANAGETLVFNDGTTTWTNIVQADGNPITLTGGGMATGVSGSYAMGTDDNGITLTGRSNP